MTGVGVDRTAPQAAGTSGGTGVLPVANGTDSVSAPPRCALQYDADRCALPLGHTEECQDSDGNGLEVAF